MNVIIIIIIFINTNLVSFSNSKSLIEEYNVLIIARYLMLSISW